MSKPRIQDDLYNHVNYEKLQELVIPDDQPCVGGFQTLAVDLEKLMIGEFKQMSESAVYPNAHLERAVKLFNVAKDVEKKNKDGIEPALRNLSILDEIVDLKSFSKNFKELKLRGIPLPLAVMVNEDMKDARHHAVYVQGPSVLLPDASYYKEAMAQQKEMIMGVWTNVARMVMAKTPLSAEEQEQYIQDTIAFDGLFANIVKTSEEWSEYVNMYNPRTTNGVATKLKTIKFKNILKDLFNDVPAKVIVAEPRYINAFTSVFNEETLTLYKHWAYVTGLLDSCSLLSEELRELGSIFYRTLAGIPANTPVEKFAYQLASGMYSEPVGLYYGEKYFGEEAKKDVTEIVYEIIDTYKKRILENEILGDETKAKAIVKLSGMGVKMGYPDKVLDIYNELVFNEEDSLFDIVRGLRRVKMLDSLADLHRDVNTEKWAMPGHMVNACYNPFANDITFPAAILQAPFYSIKQTRSENLGGIGAVVGHEISHAFDSNGAKCDEHGNINNWWTKEDFKRFNKKIDQMIKQFDGIELPWGKVNGKFIVSENMADNGGVAVTLDIMSRLDGANYEEYFCNWAKVWCLKAKPEYLQLLLNLDVHGPSILRANMPPRNFEEWYTTFNVTKDDQMYIAPNKRVVIW